MFVLSSHEIWFEQVAAVAVVLKLALHHHHDDKDSDDKDTDDGEDYVWMDDTRPGSIALEDPEFGSSARQAENMKVLKF